MAGPGERFSGRSWPLWLVIALALGFLYVPLIPSLVASLQGVRPGEWTLGNGMARCGARR